MLCHTHTYNPLQTLRDLIPCLLYCLVYTWHMHVPTSCVLSLLLACSDSIGQMLTLLHPTSKGACAHVHLHKHSDTNSDILSLSLSLSHTHTHTHTHTHCVLPPCRIQSLQSLSVQEATGTNKPVVERELAILSAFCHHIYPTLQEGEQHPVSSPTITQTTCYTLSTAYFL